MAGPVAGSWQRQLARYRKEARECVPTSGKSSARLAGPGKVLLTNTKTEDPGDSTADSKGRRLNCRLNGMGQAGPGRAGVGRARYR